MSLQIKKNTEPNFKRSKFTVDTILDKKLDVFDLTGLINKSHFSVFLGRPGSGKSSLLISFLKTPELFKKVFRTILLACPPNSRASISDDFFGKNLNEQQIYDHVDLETLVEMNNIAQANALDGDNTLIIFDDCQMFFKEKQNLKYLNHMLANRRHARLTVWMAVQNYFTIPKMVRSNITNIFAFNLGKKEAEAIFDELFEIHKDRFLDVMNAAFKQPHDYLFLDTASQRLFTRFNEIILPS